LTRNARCGGHLRLRLASRRIPTASNDTLCLQFLGLSLNRSRDPTPELARRTLLMTLVTRSARSARSLTFSSTRIRFSKREWHETTP